MGVRLRSGGLLRCGHFGAEALQLVVKCRTVSQDHGELFVAPTQRRFHLLQLLSGVRRRRCRLQQRSGVEDEPGRRPLGAGIGVAEPVAHVEQLAHRHERVVERNRAVPVDGSVAQRVDHARLAKHRFARRLLESLVEPANETQRNATD